MSWARFDDGAADHRKVINAGNEAAGAWWRMVVFSCRELTDGKLTKAEAMRYAARKAVIDRLVEVGLLELDGKGFKIHDFHTYNPSAAEVRATRAARAAAGEQGGRKSGANRRSKGEANASASAAANGQAGAEAFATAAANPDPDPDPQEKQGDGHGAGARKEPPDGPDSAVGWWSIDGKRFGKWWDVETAAYMPDAAGLKAFRLKLEGCLRSSAGDDEGDAEMVEGFARSACRALRQLVNAWTRKGLSASCTGWVGADNLDLVLRLMRGEVDAETLAQRESPRPRGAGAGGVQRGAVPVRARGATT